MRPQLLATLLTAILLPAPAMAAGGVRPGQPAPDFALKDTTGANLRLSEWRGEVVLLAFWAGWCGRCSDQLDELERLQKAYGGRGLRVVTVNIDKPATAAREAAARSGLTVLHDGGQQVAREYALANLPLTLLLDPHGTVRHVHEKYQGGDAARYEEELVALLDE